MSRDLLSVVPGRIVRHQGPARICVEFEANKRPSLGAFLRSEKESLCEVIAVENPTEVWAVVRRGPRPAVGERLTHTTAPQSVPDWRELRALTPDQPELFGAYNLPSVLSAEPEPSAILPLGLPGVDLLAPILQSGKHAWVGDHLEALRTRLKTALPQLQQHLGEQARVLWVSGRPAPPLESPDQLMLAPTTQTSVGGLAVALRAAASLATAALEVGAPLLVVFDEPEIILEAWRKSDANLHGTAAGVQAIAHLQTAMHTILTAPGPARAIVGLLPSLETATPLPGSYTGLVELFQTIATFDNDRLLLDESFGATALPEGCISAQHRQTALAVQELLSAVEGTSDHLKIFGEWEMSPAQQEIIHLGEQLTTLLVDGDAPLEETLQRCADIIAAG